MKPVARAAGVAALAIGAMASAACGDQGRRPTQWVLEGDAARGPELVRAYGCETCHVIPGIEGAHGRVGPPLAGFAELRMVGGSYPNTSENVVRWIRDAQAMRPGSGMPDLGVSEADARDIAAYLYTLR